MAKKNQTVKKLAQEQKTKLEKQIAEKTLLLQSAEKVCLDVRQELAQLQAELAELQDYIVDQNS